MMDGHKDIVLRIMKENQFRYRTSISTFEVGETLRILAEAEVPATSVDFQKNLKRLVGEVENSIRIEQPPSRRMPSSHQELGELLWRGFLSNDVGACMRESGNLMDRRIVLIG